MKKIIPYGATILALLTTSAALAKRSVPAEVAPVNAGDVEYRAPHNQMGCVEAWDTHSNQLLWRRQIYVVKYLVELERDVQDVFITSIEIEGDTLLIKNERQSIYQLDLTTLEVEVLHGLLVENWNQATHD